MISIIVALSENNVIGINNTLPWHLKADLQKFKQLTTGHHIIMGRKTFESIGKALPNRTSIIISRNSHYKIKNCLTATSIAEAIKQAESDSEAFIIGGAEIYHQSLNYADRLYLTKVHIELEGDAFFPKIDLTNWQLIEEETFSADKQNDHNFTFQVFEKK